MFNTRTRAQSRHGPAISATKNEKDMAIVTIRRFLGVRVKAMAVDVMLVRIMENKPREALRRGLFVSDAKLQPKREKAFMKCQKGKERESEDEEGGSG